MAYLYPEGEGPFDGTPVDLEALKQTYSYYALGIIARDLREWQQKREFETTAQWQQRAGCTGEGIDGEGTSGVY